jgi:integrase/recombinase XerD
MHATEIDNLGSLLAQWLDSGRRSSVHTQEAYKRDIRAFVAYSGKPIKETEPGDVIGYQAYLRQQVGSPATEYRKLSALRSFFKFLKVTKVITEDLAVIIKTPKVQSNFKAKALSVDEVKAIIDAAAPNPLDSLLLRMLYVTGGRISEVLALTWAHLRAADIGGGYVHILGKGKKEREVYIGPELWADLNNLRGELADDEKLFQLDRHEAAVMLKKAAKAAKITKNVTPHIFRHSLATNLLASGKATLMQVRDQLGHSDISTTSLYLHAEDRAAMIREMPIK